MGELAHFCMWVAVYTETITAAGNSANPAEVPRTHLLAQRVHFLEFILSYMHSHAK